MFSTLEEYYQNYRVKNGQVPNEVTLNRGPFRLKREIRELKSITDVVIEPVTENKETVEFVLDVRNEANKLRPNFP